MGTDSLRKRRLAAVLFADMVSYTALAHRDEALALALVEELRALVRGGMAAHGGRLGKEMGDGFLLTFESGLAAAQYARSLQNAVAERNRQSSPDRFFQIRIGLHLGDIECHNDDVLGNGVNIAARVMTVAGPGEICLTQPVFDQLDGECKALVVSRGPQQLKNLPLPMAIFVLAPAVGGRTTRPRRSLRAMLWVGALAGLAAAGLLWWQWPHDQSHRAAGLQLPPDGIQLAVLPFHALGSDIEELSDGLVETLTGELTRLAQYHLGLQIIPSTEVRAHKISTPDEAMKFFRVNRVLTGSVMRQNNSVKVVLSLESPADRRAMGSTSKVWEMADAFGLQEQLVAEAVSLLGLSQAGHAPETPRAARSGDAEAYLAYLKGLGLLARFDKVDNLTNAVTEFERSLKLDPKFVLARTSLAEASWRLFGATGSSEWRNRAQQEAEQVRKAGIDLPQVHSVLGLIASGTGKLEEAITEFQKAARLNPASPDAQFGLARAYANSGQATNAESTFLQAIQHSTNYWAGYNDLASFYLSQAKYELAENYFLRAAAQTPDNYEVYCNLGGLYYYMGRHDEAIKALQHSDDLRPTAEADSNLGTIYFFDGDYSAAAKMFEQAADLSAKEPTVWGNLADAWRLAHEPSSKTAAAYEKALQLTQELLEVNAEDSQRRIQLAYYFAYLDKPNDALQAAGRARKSSPTDVTVTFISALVYERGGQRAKALEELRLAAAGGYSRSEILRHPDLKDLRLDPGFAAIKDLLDEQEKAKAK